jgi:hypothetical protein
MFRPQVDDFNHPKLDKNSPRSRNVLYRLTLKDLHKTTY